MKSAIAALLGAAALITGPAHASRQGDAACRIAVSPAGAGEQLAAFATPLAGGSYLLNIRARQGRNAVTSTHSGPVPAVRGEAELARLFFTAGPDWRGAPPAGQGPRNALGGNRREIGAMPSNAGPPTVLGARLSVYDEAGRLVCRRQFQAR